MAAGDKNKKLPPPPVKTSATANKGKQRSTNWGRTNPAPASRKEPSRRYFEQQAQPTVPIHAASELSSSTTTSEDSAQEPTSTLAETFEKVLNIKLPSSTPNDAQPPAAPVRTFTALPNCVSKLPPPADKGTRKASARSNMRGFPFGSSDKGGDEKEKGSVSSLFTTLEVRSHVPKNVQSTLPAATIPRKVAPVPVKRDEFSDTSEKTDDSETTRSTGSRTSPQSIAILGESSDKRKKFVKPAPQCYHWEKPKWEHRRTHPDCQFFHPREACKYFPRCPFGAEKCGFGHPFCAPYCKCRVFERNHQYNHRDMPAAERDKAQWRDEELGSARQRAFTQSSPAREWPRSRHATKPRGPMSQSLPPTQPSTRVGVATGSNRIELGSSHTTWTGGGGNRTVKKRAKQCVYWADPKHDSSNCYFWHPRQQCKYYPKCSSGAEKCTFAHPFCSQGFCKCREEGRQRNSQLNHRVRHIKTEEGEDYDDD